VSEKALVVKSGDKSGLLRKKGRSARPVVGKGGGALRAVKRRGKKRGDGGGHWSMGEKRALQISKRDHFLSKRILKKVTRKASLQEKGAGRTRRTGVGVIKKRGARRNWVKEQIYTVPRKKGPALVGAI